MSAEVCRVCGGHEQDPVLSKIRDWEIGVEGEYDFVRCRTCAQVQLRPFPTLQMLEHAYPAHYPAFTEETQTSRLYEVLYALHQRVFSLRKVKQYVARGGRVLDVGCGNGRVLESFRRIGATELQGIDFSERVIPILERKGIRAFRGVFLDFRQDDDHYDVVVMNNYIEHVLDPRAELTKARQLLKPGGVLFGTLPNFDGIDRILFGKYWGGNHVPRHTFQYTPATLGGLLREAGYSRVEIVQDVNPCHIAVSIQNWLVRNDPDLKHNPRLRRGRLPMYNLMMLALLPVNLLFVAARRSGVMTFYAYK